jgi:hypothetical protein
VFGTFDDYRASLLNTYAVLGSGGEAALLAVLLFQAQSLLSV